VWFVLCSSMWPGCVRSSGCGSRSGLRNLRPSLRQRLLQAKALPSSLPSQLLRPSLLWLG